MAAYVLIPVVLDGAFDVGCGGIVRGFQYRTSKKRWVLFDVPRNGSYFRSGVRFAVAETSLLFFDVVPLITLICHLTTT